MVGLEDLVDQLHSLVLSPISVSESRRPLNPEAIPVCPFVKGEGARQGSLNMDLLQTFEVERLDTCGLEGFELEWDERDAPRQRAPQRGPGREADPASPSVVKGNYSAIRQHRQMVDQRKSRVLFISPLEAEEDLKSVKLTPKDKAGSAIATFTFERHAELDGLSPSESGSEKTPTSLTRRNSESQVNKSGRWFKRSWSGGKIPQ